MEINIAIRIALASIAKEQRRYAFDASVVKFVVGGIVALWRST
jgi:hypothetical protein